MKTDTPALSNAVCRGGDNNPPDVGPTSNILPEKSTDIGVSLNYAQKKDRQWFVLRVTYNRLQTAYDTLIKEKIEAYIPKHYVIKIKNGKKKRILEPLLPNFIFVYSTKNEIMECVNQHPDISYLRFYRDKTKNLNPDDGKHPPLIIDYHEMMNFIHTTSIDDEHIKLVDTEQCHYKSGDRVRVIDGKFKGVIGRVARFSGQQRVVVKVKGLCLVATAYVPSAFIEKI